jgi:hypothetical protein
VEVRYLGFDQQQNARSYRFDVIEKGQPARRFTVNADLTLFLTHHVGIQEGPTLSASKLAADLERNFDGPHELTSEDLRSHANARTLAEAQRAEMRRSPGGVPHSRKNDLPEETLALEVPEMHPLHRASGRPAGSGAARPCLAPQQQSHWLGGLRWSASLPCRFARPASNAVVFRFLRGGRVVAHPERGLGSAGLRGWKRQDPIASDIAR